MKNFIIGIDISKKNCDWCMLQEREVIAYCKVENNIEAIESKLKEVIKTYQIELRDMMICAEYTGHYIYPLTIACQNQGVDLWLESGYNIKCEAKKERGKNDKEDSRRIAEYGYKNQDDARFYTLPNKEMTLLSSLLSERDSYVTEKAKREGQLKDQKDFITKEVYNTKAQRLQKLINQYEQFIKDIEAEIEKLIQENETIKHQSKLLQSIPGVGKQTAMAMIVATRCFTLFNNGRQFCCYAGTAPFVYNSGTSIRSRCHVSHRADKEMKSLLHMCVLSLIRCHKKENQFIEYYHRKINEGKNAMSVLNAMRSKLILTMFAVIRTNQPYSVEVVHNYVENFSKKSIVNP